MSSIQKYKKGSIAFQTIDSMPLTAREEAEIAVQLMRETRSTSAGIEREVTIEIGGRSVRVKTSTTIEVK